MGNPADLGLTVGQAITNFQSAFNSNNDFEIVNNTVQLVATLTQFVCSPEAAAIANAEAGLVTLGKIQNDLANG